VATAAVDEAPTADRSRPDEARLPVDRPRVGVNARIGLTFDLTVGVLGILVGLFGLHQWIDKPIPVDREHVAAAVLVMVMAQFPLALVQPWGEVVIGFEAPALVFLTLTTSPGQALTLWAVAQLFSQGTSSKPLRHKIFNIGITGVSASALVGILTASRSVAHPNTAAELGFTLAACAAFFLIDLLATALSLSLEMSGKPRAAIRWRALPLPLLCFVGIDTLGYLAALLQRGEPRWTLALLLVPVGTILVAVRSINSSRISHDRLGRLFVAAAAAPDWGDAGETEREMVAAVSRVLKGSDAVVRERAASGEEISTPLQVRGQPLRHVVAWRRDARKPFDDDDRRALDTLVGVAEASINRRALADEMTHLARHDPLTGLANRTVFTDRLDHALELRRDRVEDDAHLAILYCDLDGFKAVNDRRGHDVGDGLLTAVAERISVCLRPGDTAARLGGDEFAVLLEQAEVDGAEIVAERLLRHLSVPFEIDGRDVAITCSVGIAYVTDELRAVDVMRHADTAMYRAKAGGRDRYEVFQPAMQRDNLRRLRLEDALREAVRDREFTVAYQPIVSLETGELTGYEALARWTHPDLGVVTPDVFIPLAEQLGLIGEIGLFILEHAHAGAVLLQAALGRRIDLSVNLSPLQISDPQLLARVRTCVARTPHVQLVLELTEMSLLADDQATLDRLDALVGAGARLAVDDFGTGYSSIAYLHRLPVSIVKIDRSFTRDLTSARSAPLVRGVIAMAQAMSLNVVAEGIEDEATAQTLRAMGAHRGQGFLWSRPIPLDRALEELSGAQSPANAWAYPPATNVWPIFG
jgi:diguanylate cyclase (GGDEF)-like protein